MSEVLHTLAMLRARARLVHPYRHVLNKCFLFLIMCSRDSPVGFPEIFFS